MLNNEELQKIIDERDKMSNGNLGKSCRRGEKVSCIMWGLNRLTSSPRNYGTVETSVRNMKQGDPITTVHDNHAQELNRIANSLCDHIDRIGCDSFRRILVDSLSKTELDISDGLCFVLEDGTVQFPIMNEFILKLEGIIC